MEGHKIDKKNLTILLAVGFIIIVTSVAFYPCIRNGFVWDDEGYILVNHYIKTMSLNNLKAIMTTPIFGNYHPITILSYAWEYFFFGLNPAPYHIVNVIFHLINCILVFYFILRLSRSIPVAFITSLLFGIHPLHVESVAWISERKDVLYAFFYLISLICYLSYLDKKPGYKYYFYTLFFFLLSILSKPMAVTLPLVLFLIDYFHDRRIAYRTIIEKIPFFVLSILSGISTLFIQQLTENSNKAFSFPKSIFVACYGLVFYLYKMVLPIKLAALYQYPPDNNLFLHPNYVIAPIIVLFLAILIIYTTKYTKKAAWGGLFYLITLLPVIQLLPIGMAVASDRYTYVPLIGIFYIISEFALWTWNNKLKKQAYLKIIVIILSFIITAQLVFLTGNLNKVWKDGITLWTNVIKQYPQTGAAYNNRGTYYVKLLEFDKALQDFFTAIKIDPKHFSSHANICNVYFMQNQNEKALPYCMEALKINPRLPNAYVTLGDIYSKSNKPLSIEMYKKSISLHYALGYTRLCGTYVSLQKYDEAYPVCSKMLEYDPNVFNCTNLGNAYLNAGHYDQALSFFLKALSVNPDLPAVHYSVAILCYKLHDYRSSIKYFEKAVSLGYKPDPVFKNLIEQQLRSSDGSKR